MTNRGVESNRGGLGAGFEATDRGAPTPQSPRRVYDNAPIVPDRTGVSEFVPGRTRVFDSKPPRDFTPVAAPERPRFPAPSGARDPSRGGLASGRRDAERGAGGTIASPSGSRRIEAIDRERREKPVLTLDQPIGGSQRDHRGLVDRYRERGVVDKPEASRISDSKAIDLSSLRRGTKRSTPAVDTADRRNSDRGSKDAPRRALDGSRRKAAIDAQRASDVKSEDHARRVSEMRREYAAKSVTGLRRLADTKPSEYADVTRRGRRVATTSGIAVTVGLGFGTGLCTGSLPGWFWDPYRSNFECNPWTNWCNTWWWGTCGWFVPSCSWSFGFWCNQSCGWWSNNWCSPWWSPRYYACPVYYTPVIYDPSPTIIYQQPVIYQSAPAADVSVEAPPAQAGEGSIAVPQRPVPADAHSADNGVGGRTATSYLDQGDAAWREGRYSDAVFFYAKAVEFAPDEGVYHLILADALFATGDYHYAAFSLRKALELEPGLLDSTLDKHNLYPNPADFDRQLAVLEQYVADHPIDDDARLLLAANYFFAKRPAQCADLLQSPFAVALKETSAAKLLSSKAQELRATKGG